jgi:hypothetical protein
MLKLCPTGADQASRKMSHHGNRTLWQTVAAILLGSIVTLYLYGYQFGHGNHSVYLLDALRRADPALLTRDWFTTQTLQYHVVFTWAGAALMKLGIIVPAFLMIYLLLVILFHVAVLGIVREAGGSVGAYLLAVVLYYLSAAGTGLGAYQFFQDSSVLPSNIASVAMLWALWLWSVRQRTWSGVLMGLAGLFHLNFALVGMVLWACLNVWRPRAAGRSFPIIGTLAAIGPSALNIAFALHSKLSRSGGLPLSEFVQLYALIRHPHHYDALSLPIGLWIAFAWTVVPALAVLGGVARRIVVLLLLLLGVAIAGAGVWFVSETLIQMSLYRFSIFVQVLGCAGAAIFVERAFIRPRAAGVLGTTGCIAIILVCAVRGPYFGLVKLPGDDPGYVELCRWASVNTSTDATFLVPPSEESMRLTGRRAIVVNYKAVPQLSVELIEWQRRMCNVLDLPDLRGLPRDYRKAVPFVQRRYSDLSVDQLLAAARRYDARYIVTQESSLPGAQRVFVDATGKWMLYDLGRGG